MFDVDEFLGDLRNRETCWLVARRDEVVRERRRLHVEELALTRVLDERGAYDATVAARDGVSERAARETIETARALESLPAVAAVAYAGDLSDEQLSSVVQLADAASDARWAEQGPKVCPVELARMTRRLSTPTAEDGRARRAARELWMKRDTKVGMLRGGFALADVDGLVVEQVFDQMIERMRPAKGQAWDTRAHRLADAFVELCRRAQAPSECDGAGEDAHQTQSPSLAPGVRLSVLVPPDGPAEIAGIPIPDAMLEALRAQAIIEPILVDEHGAIVAIGRAQSAISPKIQRAVLLRDGHCRWPGCDRTRHLHVHHLDPRSWTGTDDIANLAVVCTHHHPQLVPQGKLVLAGNPNQPDGLELLTLDAWRARGSPP